MKGEVDRGSTPRARGTRLQGCNGRRRRRFNPACAGNTSALSTTRVRWPVQPRVRGEHFGGRPPLLPFSGSTPRARGTRQSTQRRQIPARFNPACAGNTHASVRRAGTSAVQPRVRGEHRRTCASSSRRRGSTPRARGTRWGASPSSSQPWFNPACAGNTHPCAAPAQETSVQPRVRGEHTAINQPPFHASGSTPRARGTPVIRCPDHAHRRFNPACAGNTLSVTNCSKKEN